MKEKRCPFEAGALVAAYFRDSGGQDQELSVDRQEAEFRRWCQENKLVPGEVFKDVARPGSSVSGRAEFQRMMAHFRSGKAQEVGLCIWNYQRFARDMDDSQFYRADIRRRGFIFHSLNDDIPDGPMGTLFEAILDWKNAQFLEDLSVDIKSGLRYLVEQYGGMPGTPPRGFKREPIQISVHRDRVDGNKSRPRIVHRWVPDPELVPAVRIAYQMLLTGASLVEIKVATGLYNSLNSYQTFFANPIYKGTLEFGSLIIENYCEPIVDPDIWQAAQDILASRTQRKHLTGDNPQHPRRRDSRYMLSGIVYCARCGAPLNGITTGPPENPYEQYLCSRGRRNRDCDAMPIPRIFLEDQIVLQLRNFLLDPDNLEEQQKVLLQGQSGKIRELTEQRQALADRLEDVHRRIARVAETLEEVGKSAALVHRLAELEADETLIQSELAKVARAIDDLQLPFEPLSSADLQTLTRHLMNELDTNARDIVRGLINRIAVEREDKVVRFSIEYFFPNSEKPPWGGIIGHHTKSVTQYSVGASRYRLVIRQEVTVQWVRKRRTTRK